MKTRQTILYGILAVTLILTFTACDFLLGKDDDDNGTKGLNIWIYDDTARVSSHQDKDKISGAVIIPSTYNGKPVTHIGDRAFLDCTKLTSITIPASVTRIEGWAFEGCTGLTTVNIAEESRLQYIGRSAFLHCTSLTSITIPAGVTKIGEENVLDYEGTFRGCTSLQSVIFAKGSQLQNIHSQTFRDCTSLTSINIPEGVTSIGIGDWNSAFRNCSSLTGITIPASVTTISDSTFRNCTNLRTVTFAADSQLDYISNWAFEDCANLANITIPERVTVINAWAFRNCTGITEIIIPAGVTSVGSDVFYGWTSSQTIYIKRFASEDEATAYSSSGWWISNWRNGCNAVRKYWNGSEWV